MVQLTIDGKQIEVPEGTTVLRAAKMAGIHIPTLCDHKELTPYGGCRLCIVEVEKWRVPMASCTLPVSNGMVVHTRNRGDQEIARVHPFDALQRAQPLLPVLPGQRRRLRTSKCRLSRRNDPLAHPTGLEQLRGGYHRTRILCWITTAVSCAAAVCAPAVNWRVTSPFQLPSAAQPA